jgi:hypothetical protein
MKLKVLIVAGFLIAYSATSAAMQGQKLPGDNVIIPSVDEKWGEVAFTHQKHLAYSDCTYCHHTNKGLTLDQFNAGKSEKVPLCAECHTREEGNAKTPKSGDGTEIWSKEAYHVNCIDCHKGEITKKPKDAGAIKKQGEGPTKCDQCHVKK